MTKEESHEIDKLIHETRHDMSVAALIKEIKRLREALELAGESLRCSAVLIKDKCRCNGPSEFIYCKGHAYIRKALRDINE